MAKASWSCRSSSPVLWGHACSGSAPPEWEPADRLPPRLGAEGAEEAGAETKEQMHGRALALVHQSLGDKGMLCYCKATFLPECNTGTVTIA